jgi:hypothetical protein
VTDGVRPGTNIWWISSVTPYAVASTAARSAARTRLGPRSPLQITYESPRYAGTCSAFCTLGGGKYASIPLSVFRSGIDDSAKSPAM